MFEVCLACTKYVFIQMKHTLNQCIVFYNYSQPYTSSKKPV